MSDAPSAFGSPGGPQDTIPVINPTDPPSGTNGRAEMDNLLGSALAGTQVRVVALETTVAALQTEVTTDEGTYATITDGTLTGGEIYIGTTASIPSSPPARFVAFPTDFDITFWGAWVANKSSPPYPINANVTNGGTLYQNNTGAPISSRASFDATEAAKWTAKASLGGATASTAIPLPTDSPGGAGSATPYSREDHVHPDVEWTANDMGYLTWSFPSSSPVNQYQMIASTPIVVKLHLPVAATVNNVHLAINTGGGTLTNNQCFAALFSGAGALLALTADQHTNWTSVGQKKMALATGQSVAAGDCYVVAWANGTTLPQLARQAGLAGMANGNIATAANSRFATDSHTVTTTVPTTLGTLTALDAAIWAALST